MLLATAESVHCLCPKHCSHLDTDIPASLSGLLREGRRGEGLSCLSCLLAAPNSILWLPCSIVTEQLSFPSVFCGGTHCGWSWVSWIVYSNPGVTMLWPVGKKKEQVISPARSMQAYLQRAQENHRPLMVAATPTHHQWVWACGVPLVSRGFKTTAWEHLLYPFHLLRDT